MKINFLRRMLAGMALLYINGVAMAATPEVSVRDVTVKGRIEGENITFDLAFVAETSRRKQSLPLVSGDVVLTETSQAIEDYAVSYNAGNHTYSILEMCKTHCLACFIIADYKIFI